MKSLEIVNRERDKLKADIDLGVIQKRNVELQNIDIAKLKELGQIKQDLEVLEILKKRSVNLSHLLYLFMRLKMGKIKDINDVHIAYNIFSDEESYLTLGEILKIKQWLEENEKWDIDII